MRTPRTLLFVLATLLVTTQVSALAGGGIDTVFAIRRSSSRNRVDYGIRLDENCRPRGDSPVVPYHRRLAVGPNSTRSIAGLEHLAYGVRDQRVARAEGGGSVDIRLRAVDRRIHIVTEHVGEQCVARPFIRVRGQQAELTDVFVVLTGPRSVDHVEITGRMPTGEVVRENIQP